MVPRGKAFPLLTFLALVSVSVLFSQSPAQPPSFSDPTAALTGVTLSGTHGVYVAPFAVHDREECPDRLGWDVAPHAAVPI